MYLSFIHVLHNMNIEDEKPNLCLISYDINNWMFVYYQFNFDLLSHW